MSCLTKPRIHVRGGGSCMGCPAGSTVIACTEGRPPRLVIVTVISLTQVALADGETHTVTTRITAGHYMCRRAVKTLSLFGVTRTHVHHSANERQMGKWAIMTECFIIALESPSSSATRDFTHNHTLDPTSFLIRLTLHLSLPHCTGIHIQTPQLLLIPPHEKHLRPLP